MRGGKGSQEGGRKASGTPRRLLPNFYRPSSTSKAETIVRNAFVARHFKRQARCAHETGVYLQIERFRPDRRGRQDMARPAIRERLAQFGCPVIARRRVDVLLVPVVGRRLASGDEHGGEAPQCFV